MVRQRSDSSAYRTSQEVPETPLTPRTPRTPRSPHLHRSRLTSPSARSWTGTRGGLKREFPEDEDLDMDDLPSRRAHLPNPTPSELLSMDLTTLALHNRNTNSSNSSSSSSGSRSALTTPSPSARFRDDATVERFNLTLPFDRIASPNFASSISSSSTPSPSPFKSNTNNNHSNNNLHSSSSLESVHRYPTRTATTQHDTTQSSPFTTPVKAGGGRTPFLRDGPSTPAASSSTAAASSPSPSIFSSRSALQSPPRSSPRQFMNDEDNNLFLTQSPRAIRTPRKPMSQLESSSNFTTQSPADRSTPSTSASAQASFSSGDYSASTNSHSYFQPVPTSTALMTPGASQSTEFYDDDMTDTESVLSSQGDQEKENVTPKMSDDPSNPFFVSSESKRTIRYTKTDGSTTPTGCTTAPGTIRRSRRLALGSISPWRWNSFDEQGNLLHAGLGVGFLKGKGSDWTEGKHPKGTAAGCSGELSAGSSSGSSSAAGSSSTNKAVMIGPPLNGKSSKQLPDNHPNASDTLDRKGVPSKTAMKNAESIIEPQSVAFNRRAQKVAGSIFYWKNGNYQLVSETDKQQWPGEWKFEVYQDPESPGAPSAAEEADYAAATSHSFTAASSSTTATYFGKGKLTDRQLSGPSSKRMRVTAGNETSHQGVGSSPHTSESDLTGSGITDAQDLVPPPSPTPMSAINTSANNSPQASKLMGSRPGTPSKKARMQDRYDFRERRMLNEPLTPRSRRCGA
ncbi:hypothetical protein KI688_004036 [Linnemannia hyalina]|uniref:Uncharacterized protein n=1 Tax=Linnemannia hyalina TaxID=64524 RepID=A0A9P7XNT2_9FUNG|nr:hypothetical protein KI688_004036 [Linnemannia hyalina]